MGVAVPPHPPPPPPTPPGLTLGGALTEVDAVKLPMEGEDTEDTVALEEAEEVGLGREEALAVLEPLAVPVAAPLPVPRGLTLVPLPSEELGVGVEEGVLRTDQEELGVPTPLPVPAQGEAVAEGEGEMEGVPLEEDEGVGLLVAVVLKVGVVSADLDAKELAEGDAVRENRVACGVMEGEGESEGEGLMESVAVRERDTVFGGDCVAVMVPPDTVALGERVEVQVALCVTVPVLEAVVEGDRVAVPELLGEGVVVREGEVVLEELRDRVGLPVAVVHTVGVALPPVGVLDAPVALPLGNPLALALPLPISPPGDPVPNVEPVRVTDTVGEPLPAPLAVALTVEDKDLERELVLVEDPT